MRKRIYALLAGLAATAMMTMLVVFVIVPGFSQSPAAPTQEVASTPNSPVEGIEVHGHWTLEVRNQDGSMAERREFDNGLYIPLGYETLVKLLGRQNSVGGWEIHLISSSISPFTDGASGGDGILIESSNTGTAANMFKTLTLTVTTSPARLRLSGTATAQRDGSISIVETRVTRLPATAPPSSEYEEPYSGHPFTSTGLSGGDVVLSSGQQVLVTVDITFS